MVFFPKSCYIINMSTQRRANDNFIKQGSILAIASILSRIIGLLYRSPVNHIIGDSAMGLYSIAFEVYSLALILSSYSMPLAVSKLLSARFAKKEYRNGARVFQFAMGFAIVSGLLMTVIILVSADGIEKLFNYEGLAVPLRVLAPTIFVVAIAGTIRGFFQSRKSMLPTAVSQLLEQFANALFSIVFALIFISPQVTELGRKSWGAAGSTMGTFLGAVISLVFLIFLLIAYKKRFMKRIVLDTTDYRESGSDIFKSLMATILPVILSQAIYQSIGIIDSLIFGNFYTGASDKDALIGIYSKYRTMVNIPIAIASSLASSMIPVLVSLFTLNRKTEFNKKLGLSVKFNMIIAFPCAMGFAVIGVPIMRILFPTTDYIQSGTMLIYGGIAVLFYALSTISNAALQGMDKMRLPMIHAAVSLGIHIVLMFLLLNFTSLGINVLVIGNVTYPLVVCILNWVAIAKHSTYRQEIKKTFIIPFIAAIGSGLIVFGLSRLLLHILPDSYFTNLITVIICIIVAAVSYFSGVFLLKGLTMEDMPDFPMGMRIARVARRFHLLK